MTMTSGGCQCGAIRFQINAFKGKAHVCHCRMCQKAVGNLFATLVDVTKFELTWTRGTPAMFFSSAEISRGFCNACGTPLFYGHPDGYGICIGAFDDPGALPLSHECSMEARLPQNDHLGRLRNMGTTQEDMGKEAVRIAASNRQHPDHDTDVWPPVSR